MVNVTDTPPNELDNKHVISEHGEAHLIVSVLRKIRQGVKGGWQHHPNVLKWIGKREALRLRHDALAVELVRRGYEHNSPMEAKE